MDLTKILMYLLIIAVVLAAVMFYRFILSYLVISLIVAYLLDPLVTFWERHHVPRWLSILITYTSILMILIWSMYQLIPTLSEQGRQLFELVEQDTGGERSLSELPLINGVIRFLQSVDNSIPGVNLVRSFDEFIESAKIFLGHLPQLIVNNYQTILGAISFIVIVPVISFFLLKDGQRLKRGLLAVIPNRYFEIMIIIINKIDVTAGRYIRALIYEAISVGVLCSIALSVVGVNYAVLIGMTAGVANVIPYFGPMLGLAIAILSILISGMDYIYILYAAIAMYSVQAIDNNYLYPVVIGKAMDMHPLLVFLTVLAGGLYAGILGMLISVPVVHLVYSVVSVLYSNLKQFKII